MKAIKTLSSKMSSTNNSKNIDFEVFKGGDKGIQKSKTTKELKPNDVLIQITHSGLCGTDIHYKGADMALGHEGVGVVKEVGQNVTLFKSGDRAGWGYLHHACGHCKQCLRGHETFCPERKMYAEADLDQGSMGQYAIWDENYIFHVPDGLDSEFAAPLMCGGSTVWNALRFYPPLPSERVGIVGIGGLGHLAIQYAAKMGLEVVVFSGTDSKKDEALSLGAKEFHATKGVKELKDVKQIDRLIITTSAQPDWNLFLPLMVPTGSIYPLSVSMDDLKLPYMPLLVNGLRIQGGIVSPRQIHQEMLDFSALHQIKPIIQKFPMTLDGIGEAFKTLEDGKMRYRGVLVA